MEMHAIDELRYYLRAGYTNLNFEQFCTHVLQAPCHIGDTWQVDMFRTFQQLCQNINRFDEEHLHRLVTIGFKLSHKEELS